MWTGYATNDDFIAKHPDALIAFNRAWVEAVNYVKSHPEVMTAYGKQFGLDEQGTELLRQRVVADYVMEWNSKSIAELNSFAKLANSVMGQGYLDTLPPAAFSTRFVAAPK